MPISKELEEMFQSCKDMDKASELLDLALEYLPEEKWIGTTVTINQCRVTQIKNMGRMITEEMSLSDELSTYKLTPKCYKELRERGYTPLELQRLKKEGIEMKLTNLRMAQDWSILGHQVVGSEIY